MAEWKESQRVFKAQKAEMDAALERNSARLASMEVELLKLKQPAALLRKKLSTAVHMKENVVLSLEHMLHHHRSEMDAIAVNARYTQPSYL